MSCTSRCSRVSLPVIALARANVHRHGLANRVHVRHSEELPALTVAFGPPPLLHHAA